MKNISVTTFIHTIFILALIVISLTFYILLNATQDQRRFQQINRYKYIADTYLTNEDLDKNSPILKELYKKHSLKPVPIDDVKDEVEEFGKTIFSGHSIFGRVRVFNVEGEFYIYIERINFTEMLKDEQPIDYTTQLIFTIAVILVLLLLFIYLMVLKKLSPLKKLHKQIENFAKGDLNIKITYSGDDEIARIAKSFQKAINYINQLISSKNLFMRNIMHELKTPITTSRILAESVKDEHIKTILIRSFDRMNELISELAQIERYTMHNFKPEIKRYKLSEVFRETKKMLFKDKKQFEFKYVDEEILTDKKILALILKNLIDNGIKYSPNHFVRVEVVGNKILVKSKGEKLKEDLSYYIEPFSQEEKRSLGFGLGLYIVANLTEKLRYDFKYKYDDRLKENIFKVVID